MIRQINQSKWTLPLFSLAMGIVIFAVSWAGGHPALGVVELGIMAGFGLLVLVSGRSETVRGLRGDGRDERFARMDLQATATAGVVLILVLIACWLVQVARGRSGDPYQWLLAVSGVTYLGSVVYLRWRG
jgi:hypothetical protein